jgi:hypothetical protein
VDALDPFRAAKLLIDQHGEQEAWRILTARALDEHLAGNLEHRGITQTVLSALHELTRGAGRDDAAH